MVACIRVLFYKLHGHATRIISSVLEVFFKKMEGNVNLILAINDEKVNKNKK